MKTREGIKGCLYSLACLFITVVLSCGVFFYVLFSAMRWDKLIFLPVSTNIEGYEVVVLENGVVRLNSSSCKVLLSLLSRTRRNDRFEFAFDIIPKAGNTIVIESIKYNVTTVSGKTLRLTQYFPDQKEVQNGRLVAFGRILNVDIPKQDRRRPVVVTLSFVLKDGKEGKEQKHEITLMLRPQIVTRWMPLAVNLLLLQGEKIARAQSVGTKCDAEGVLVHVSGRKSLLERRATEGMLISLRSQRAFATARFDRRRKTTRWHQLLESINRATSWPQVG